MAYSKSIPQTAYFPEWGHVVDGASPSTVPLINNRRIDWVDTKSGEKMPEYKTKIREGKSAATPFSCDYSNVINQVPGYYSHSIRNKYDTSIVREYKWKGYGFGNATILPPAHLALSTNGAEAKALTKTYQKVKSETQHMNAPAFFAEFMDVLHQFGHPARAIIDLTNRRLNRLALERKRIVGSNSFKRIKWDEVVASTYLEYVFGLRPLISDTKRAAEAYARFVLEQEELQHYRSKISSRAVEETSTFITDVSDTTLGVSVYKTRKSIKTVTKARCQYTVGLNAPPIPRVGSNERLLELLGFDMPNVIPAIWEGIPWSWLVDYFANVQDILEAGATGTINVAWISKSVSRVTDVSYLTTQIVPDDPSPWTLNSVDGKNNTNHAGLAKVRRTTVTRTVPPSLGIPPLVFSHPFEDYWKIANMAATMFARKGGNSALWIF